MEVAQNTQPVSPTGGGELGYRESVGFDNNPTALVPAEPMSEFIVDGIDLAGIEYIDGKLHIQTAARDNLDDDNHGFFYLMDENGNKIDYNYNFYLLNHQRQPGRIDYCNYVFDVPQEELANYTLHGDFVTSAMKTEGNRKATFPLESGN
ncbi:MAG: hypothetical protein RSC55_01485 [Oscillospiraceae bacterium]